VADYFVTTSERSDLRVESAQLAQAITQRWPDVRFIERDDAANTIRWAIPMREGRRELWGELHDTGQTVALDGDDHDVAEFARWLRQQIPGRYPLVFFDESYTRDVPLTESTSAEELIQPFLAQIN
jgi:hypothetical protein